MATVLDAAFAEPRGEGPDWPRDMVAFFFPSALPSGLLFGGMEGGEGKRRLRPGSSQLDRQPQQGSAPSFLEG